MRISAPTAAVTAAAKRLFASSFAGVRLTYRAAAGMRAMKTAVRMTRTENAMYG